MEKLAEPILVVGLGVTGLSCVRYLSAQGYQIAVADSRDSPPNQAELAAQFPQVCLHAGEFDPDVFSQAETLVMSPGVSLHQPIIAEQIKRGAEIVGDIELFSRAAKAPIIAITGSNGKTTVTTLMGEMIAHAGYSVKVCGNIGQPVLDLLNGPQPDFYVMELSSFQLETVSTLAAKVAVLLNLSPDHMDRYQNLAQYLRAKQRIYQHCEIAVLNADERDLWLNLPLPESRIYFSLQKNGQGVFGLTDDQQQLTFDQEPICSVSELPMQGKHHYQNTLAALALGYAIGLAIDVMLSAIRSFAGLPHRCELVSQLNQVKWYNDSKATNAGASAAAIETLGQTNQGKLFLIAGGDAKQADLSALKQPVHEQVDTVFLYGQDADRLADVLSGCAALQKVENLQAAVQVAYELAKPNDVVLLSPACASFDMFDNYQHRGEMFVEAIKELEHA